MVKIFVVIAAFTALSLSYMNCGETRLMRAKNSITSSSTITGKACGQNNGPESAPRKIAFVIDMSYSNIANCAFGTPPNKNGSDPTGLRLKEIITLLDSPGCNNPNNQYSLIGFSDIVLRNVYPNVDPTPQDPDKNKVCKRFVPRDKLVSPDTNGDGKSEPTGLLLDLLNVNNSAPLNCSDTGEMKLTNYQEALSCHDELINEDIDKVSLEEPQKLKDQRYYTYFMSDGRPSAGPPYVFIDVNQADNYANQVKDTVTMAKQLAGSLILQSIYYGSHAEPDYGIAQTFLNKMTQAGGTQSVLELVPGAMNLCNLTQVPLRVGYRLSHLTVVNLTARMQQGLLKVDSDADGIPDDQETPSGKTNRRNNQYHLLDSVCAIKNCTNPLVDLSGMTCAPLDVNQMSIDPFLGISKCDIEAMGLEATNTLDDDNDSIPDIIEIMRSTLQNVPDANIPDGPGFTILSKIQRGRQPYFPEHVLMPPIPLHIEINAYSAQKLPPTGVCGTAEEHDIHVLNNPLVPTVAYTAPKYGNVPEPQEKNFSHGNGENIILVYFYSAPYNSTYLETEIYAAIFKMSFGSQTKVLTKDDFKLVGTIHAE